MRANNACFLAFDTSLYTTSAALVCENEVLYDKRIMLAVPKGKRGLRQSEAVFEHIKNSKQLFSEYSNIDKSIKAVAYSSKPCPRADSYMPVFGAGESFAALAAALLGVPLFGLTHQHGHIYSAFLGNCIENGQYCVFHVSGGTLDLLKVNIDGAVTDIEKLGGTLDITCGQLIDRIGVAAGLSFPSGKQIEKIYSKNDIHLAVNVKGLSANLSGAETQALRMLEQGADKDDVLSAVIDCSADTIIQLIKNAAKDTNIKNFIFTGGVICNTIIREKITKVCAQNGYGCVLAQKKYSGDNACGLALAAKILYGKGEKY